MNKEKPIISFYYPAENIGGAQLLFARVAMKLHLQGFIIKVYQHSECYISKFLETHNVTFEKISSKINQRFLVNRNELFILSLSYASMIQHYFNFDTYTKFIFWDLNHFCLLDQTVFQKLYKTVKKPSINKIAMYILENTKRNKLKLFVDNGVRLNGLVFMSEYDFIYNRNIFNIKNADFIPIPVEIHYSSSRRGIDRDVLRIGWISRMVREKCQILTLLMDDIKKTGNENISLTIIGDGKDVEFVKNYARKINLYNVFFVGQIQSSILSEYLNRNIDIGFSVGTSALEFAVNKIPTVLMPNKTDVQYFRRRERKYAWLHKMNGNDVATFKEDNKSYIDFSTILYDYSINSDVISKLTYNYAKINHDIDQVILKLMDKIDHCCFTFKDINELGINELSRSELFTYRVKCIFKSLVSLLNFKERVRY